MIAAHDHVEVVDGDRLKVLWVSQRARMAAVKTADDRKAVPYIVDFEEIETRCSAGEWRIVPGEMPVFRPETLIPQNQLDKRNRSWAIVGPLVTSHAPDVFIKRKRVQLVAEAAKTHGVSTVTVKTLLKQAFHGGMVADALLPGWERIGNPGQARPASEGARKRGRPVKHGGREGCNVTADMKRIFLIAADHYDGDARLDLPAAYRRMVRMFFSEIADELHQKHGQRVALTEYENCGLPRFEQFRYYVARERDREAVMRRRLGDRVYGMTRRALLDDSTAEAWGLGARFQIDATVVDAYVRSRRNRRRLVGRPTLYVVIDVFSRMIVGFSLSFDPPSWLGAMTALANAVTDKVSFCAKFGISIEAADWPCQHICAILEGDRGEIEGQGVLGILRRFNIDVQNASAYRADWKGIVERRFGILQSAWKPFVEGYVDVDFKDRGARDYRLDAVLDIDDLTRIIIRQILYYNNFHDLVGYPKLPEMTEDGVPAVPRELWRWGIANKSGLLRSPREEPFLFALLPTATATVTPSGIYYHGCYYTCPRAVRDGWFSKARDKRFKVPISFDKRDGDRIYVHDAKAPEGYEVAVLTPTSSRRAGSSGWEIEDLMLEDKAISANRRDEQLLARVDMEADNEADVVAAKAKFDAGGAQGSIASQVSGLRQAVTEERAADRIEDAADYRERMGVAPTGTALEDGDATVIPFLPPTEAETDYGAPSMRELIARTKGDAV